MLNSTGINGVNAKQPSIRRVLHCFDKNIHMAIGVIKEEEHDANNYKNENDSGKKINLTSGDDSSTTMTIWSIADITQLQNALRKYPKLDIDNGVDVHTAELERWFLIL